VCTETFEVSHQELSSIKYCTYEVLFQDKYCVPTLIFVSSINIIFIEITVVVACVSIVGHLFTILKDPEVNQT